MDRNFRTFLILSTALLFLFMGLQKLFLPNGPVKNQAANQPAAKDGAKQPPNADKPADATKADAAEKGAVAPGADKPQAPEAERSSKEQVITLGSMDPKDNYRLLVTLTSRGAGLERVELVDEKKVDRFRYRAIEHRGGYLGYLGWRPATDGVKITTIPVGSAAASAKSPGIDGGLQSGDILNSVNDSPVTSYNGLQRILTKIKPGTEVKLSITRQVDEKPTPLVFTAELAQPPLDALRTQDYLAEQVRGNLERLSCLTTLASINDQRIPIGARSIKSLSGTLTDNWEVAPLDVPEGQGVEFRLSLSDYLKNANISSDLVLIKRYRLMPWKDDPADALAAKSKPYTLDFETVIENKSQTSVDVSLRHEALAGLNLEGWWYSVKVSPYFFRGAGQRDIRFADEAGHHSIVMTRSVYDRELKTPTDPGLFVDEGGSKELRSLKYVGLDSQYFAAAFLPHPEAPEGLKNLHQAGSDAVANVKSVVNSQAQATNIGFWFETESKTLEPGASMSTRYQVFAGPKDTGILAYFGLDRFIEYGWIPLITKPLSAILYAFYSVVRNYGIAIIMLTILVRGCMFPLGRQAAINGQKMQEMAPEMKRINDQYKDDMQKRAEATRELYAKYGFRPLASCLPIFVQLPVLMGLYRCLSVDISLRQEPLIPGLSWCSNLAGPDMLYDWSGWMPEIIAGRGTGYLGPYFNILPVITIALFLVQQKVLMPKATDEQTQMTQNMMQIMTVVMGVLFFKVPSGLCIYFITSSLWSLAERKMVKRLVLPTTTTPSTPTPPANNGPAGNNKRRSKDEPQEKKPSRFAERMAEIKDMLDKPAVKSATQRRDGDKRRKR